MFGSLSSLTVLKFDRVDFASGELLGRSLAQTKIKRLEIKQPFLQAQIAAAILNEVHLDFLRLETLELDQKNYAELFSSQRRQKTAKPNPKSFSLVLYPQCPRQGQSISPTHRPRARKVININGTLFRS
jgi:hypothetical protein